MLEIEYKKFNKRMKDLTGYKFGSLEVLKYLGVVKDKNITVWECRCDCGNIKRYTISEVNKCKSCGCKRYPSGDDLIGIKFGKLTVLEKIGIKNKISIYRCRCDCGNYTDVYRTALVGEDTKSCGCLQQNYYNNHAIDYIKKYQVDGTNIAYLKSNKLSKANTSGVRGVSKKRNGKWLAQIVFKRKTYNLGTYENKEDAIKARKEGEEKLHKQFIRDKEILDD